ncbi:MAG: TetR family transcriptional regulator [Actinomycetales bacterium]|nr:MAG: TetR family transcriptional regulator [Actinomycetales bacterium]
MTGPTTVKGQRRRRDLIEAAAELLREGGPTNVSMRNVAKRVGSSLSATTYYFKSADELLEEAGRLNIGLWAERAERVADEAEAGEPPATLEEAMELVLRATLPKRAPLLGHYSQLIAAGTSEPVTRAYNTGRNRLNLAVARVLKVSKIEFPAELVISVVDGAAVSALSEGRDVHQTARKYLQELLAECVRRGRLSLG